MGVNDLPLSVLKEEAKAAVQDAWSALGDGGCVLLSVHPLACGLHPWSSPAEWQSDVSQPACVTQDMGTPFLQQAPEDKELEGLGVYSPACNLHLCSRQQWGVLKLLQHLYTIKHSPIQPAHCTLQQPSYRSSVVSPRATKPSTAHGPPTQTRELPNASASTAAHTVVRCKALTGRRAGASLTDWNPWLTYEAHMGIVYKLMEEADGVGAPADTGQQDIRVPPELLQALLPRLAPDDCLEVTYLQDVG